ncbi:alpha-keto acid decarboxylase family protein [Serratia sp. DD3]|uniref:alpha-keto acid decarboxylase family protein n=1 Tax=Serratia sp. DD3 TaxID=1410619 RepID=UPI0004D7AB23|nr:thiamine pyrophosphate-binding protein [Serratia sp. DD3]KEY58425.1 indole-3-pyruvate decarboxylase [Serratia sp. DD3]
MEMAIGEFLIRRLAECGIDKMFGVPGDFNLSLLNQVTQQKEITWIGNCNELNAAYAADGYARMHGMGAILTTYAVGDLSALNGIAGCYAEYVPVVHVSGALPIHAQYNRTMTHHTLLDGGVRNIQRAVSEFTVAQAELTPENAVREIDRVLLECYQQLKPVHIFIPSDITHLKIEVPEEKIKLSKPYQNVEMLQAATAHIAACIDKAKNPAILIDLPALRWNAINTILACAEKHNIPVAYTTAVAGNILNDHPMVVGLYCGSWGDNGVQEIIESSDCLLGFGLRNSDDTTGYFSGQLPPVTKQIQIQPFWVRCGNPGGKVFNATHMVDLMQALTSASISRKSFTKPLPTVKQTLSADPASHIFEAALWQRIEGMLRQGDILVAETGTSNANLSSITFPKNTTYVTQLHWGSIGYALPAALGCALGAPDRHVILSQGDGSHQLTAQELSTIMRNKVNMTMFLLNNNGYTIERSIMGATCEYNDVNDWDYAGLTKVLDKNNGGTGVVVETIAELDAAIEKARTIKGLFLIEVKLKETDMSEGMVRSGRATMNFDYGVVHPSNDLVVKH